MNIYTVPLVLPLALMNAAPTFEWMVGIAFGIIGGLFWIIWNMLNRRIDSNSRANEGLRAHVDAMEARGIDANREQWKEINKLKTVDSEILQSQARLEARMDTLLTLAVYMEHSQRLEDKLERLIERSLGRKVTE
jgi:hypothetical protein